LFSLPIIPAMEDSPALRPLRVSLTRFAVLGGSVLLFVVLPLIAIGVVFGDLASGAAGWGFRDSFSGAADAVLHGTSPYPGIDDPSLAAGLAYVYPPLIALLAIPFAPLSAAFAVLAYAAILVVALVATLYALDVRDWRCYGLVFLWPPVLSAVHVENVTILLGLGAALAWRWRHEPRLIGLALGVTLAAKPLLWPFVFWLVPIRRARAALWAVASAALLTLLAWAVIGFAGFTAYPSLVHRLSDLMDSWGYTLYAVGLDLGLADGPARALWLLGALVTLVAAAVVSRRGDDRRGFILALAAVIGCSPIVWMHYFALLVIVVAVAEPTLGPAWFVPLLMYPVVHEPPKDQLGNGTPFETVATLVIALVTVLVALRPSRLAALEASACRLRERGAMRLAPRASR
jgi:alpha-1,2-mannosyltransferase